jgi:hypothetical protein
VSSGVERHERALRDHPFSIASQRFEKAIRQARSVPSAGQLLRHLRVEQDEAALTRRPRARRRRMAFQAGSLMDFSGYGRGNRGEPCLSGRTTTNFVGSPCDPRTCFSAAAGRGPQHFVCSAIALGHCDALNCMPRQISSPCFTARTEDLSQQALLEHSRRTLVKEAPRVVGPASTPRRFPCRRKPFTCGRCAKPPSCRRVGLFYA